MSYLQERANSLGTGLGFVELLGNWTAGGGALRSALAAAMTDAANSGALKAGTRLPSERALARELAVSRSTVVAAYETLRTAGLVESRHGSGTYIAAPPPPGRDEDPATVGMPVFRRLLAGSGHEPHLISLALATVPGTPAIAEELVRLAATVPALLDEPGYWATGLPALQRGIAASLTADGLPTTASQVLVTTGAHQAITLCAALFVKPGDLVVVEDPTYPGCVDAFAAAGARFASLPVDGNGAQVNQLARILQEEAPAALYLMPSYQNPTGTALSEQRRRLLAEVAARTGIPIIEDNSLRHAVIAPDPPPPPIAAYLSTSDQDAPIITIGSLSKSLWGGLRVGWLRTNEPWFGRLARRKVAADLGSGVLDQAVAAGLIERLPELAERSSTLLRRRLASTEVLLRRRIPEWTWQRPAGGSSLWIRLPGTNAASFSDVALDHGVELIGGGAFSPMGTSDDHIRLPFACEPSVMAEAIDRLATAWASHHPGDAARRTSLGTRQARVVV